MPMGGIDEQRKSVQNPKPLPEARLEQGFLLNRFAAAVAYA